MKKLIALATLAAFCIPAFASSQVTLYGKIDESVLVGKARHGDTIVQVKSGFTAGSRWGLKGVEELGNGYKVGFILEQGFTADDGEEGASGLAFNRESSLYVEGGFGKLTFGRLGTLGFAQSVSILRGGVFGVTHGAAGWGTTGNLHFSRVDNAIAYASPSFGGVSLHAMYSNATNTDDSDEKWSKNNHYYGLGALYKNKDLNASIIFETVDNKAETGVKKDKPLYHITIGGWYQLGIVRPMAVYQYQTGDNQYDQHAFQIGSQIKLSGGTAKLGFKYVNRKLDGKASSVNKERKMSLWNIGASYEYPLSKRTKVYGFAGFTDGQKGWSKGSQLKNVNYNGYQMAVGMVHDF